MFSFGRSCCSHYLHYYWLLLGLMNAATKLEAVERFCSSSCRVADCRGEEPPAGTPTTPALPLCLGSEKRCLQPEATLTHCSHMSKLLRSGMF